MTEPSKEAKDLSKQYAGDPSWTYEQNDNAVRDCALAIDALLRAERTRVSALTASNASLVEALVAARYHIQGSSPLAALSSIADALAAQEVEDADNG